METGGKAAGHRLGGTVILRYGEGECGNAENQNRARQQQELVAQEATTRKSCRLHVLTLKSWVRISQQAAK